LKNLQLVITVTLIVVDAVDNIFS